MHLPFALSVVLAITREQPWLLAPLVLLPWATTLAQRVAREPAGAWLNAALGATARLGLAFALLLSLGALVKV
jgi:1,4-dihydroxy-2-naphthoate octaprenyltransferase